MSIQRRVRSVELLFHQLEKEIAQFQSHTKLHCIAGCGKCCTKPDVDATPLEFLPWAYHIFLEGMAMQVLEEIKKQPTAICHLYRSLTLMDNTKGSCSDYPHRGLICRLFGFAAGRDKLGLLRLATCKIIKENQSEDYERTVVAINNGLSIPIFSDYYQKLAQIDFRLGNQIVPINRALQLALEEVLHYYAYRPLPLKFKKVG
ncbi:MAG: YkgJ family cysteine cluster protein [Maribacter sp.]|nr:YkgJ family cysteine cluster protein [Maribacter sp.]